MGDLAAWEGQVLGRAPYDLRVEGRCGMQSKTVIYHVSDPQAPGPLHMPSAPNAGFSSCLSPWAKTTSTLGGTPQLPLSHPTPSAW